MFTRSQSFLVPYPHRDFSCEHCVNIVFLCSQSSPALGLHSDCRCEHWLRSLCGLSCLNTHQYAGDWVWKLSGME